VLNEKALVSRNDFIVKMAEFGIGTSVHYKPMHRMTYYRTQYHLTPEQFPVAEKIWQGNVSLPIYSLMSQDDMEEVVKAVKSILL
jgi:dTDP-4-amino-4,6-dideoxygalactose transaminase